MKNGAFEVEGNDTDFHGFQQGFLLSHQVQTREFVFLMYFKISITFQMHRSSRVFTRFQRC